MDALRGYANIRIILSESSAWKELQKANSMEVYPIIEEGEKKYLLFGVRLWEICGCSLIVFK